MKTKVQESDAKKKEVKELGEKLVSKGEERDKVFEEFSKAQEVEITQIEAAKPWRERFDQWDKEFPEKMKGKSLSL